MPYHKAQVWKNAHRRVLLLFVPITLISTPLGQLVSDGVPTSIVQAVAGVLVTFVACWELYSKRKWFLSFLSLCQKNKSKEKEDGNQTDGADDTVAHHAAERGEASVVEEMKEESNETKEENKYQLTIEMRAKGKLMVMQQLMYLRKTLTTMKINRRRN